MDIPIEDGGIQTSVDNKTFVKSEGCYNILKQLFMENIPEEQFPTYKEWVAMVDGDELHDPTLVGFVPGGSGPAAAAAASAFARRVGVEAFKASGLNLGTADELLNSMRATAEQKIRQRVKETASQMFEKFTDTGDGGTSETNYLGGSRFNPTGLSQTLKPIDTGFSTSITFQGQTRYWQDGKENSGPLFLKTGVPGLITTADNTNRDQQIWDFIDGPITMEWNTAIARKVTWTGRVVDLLTEIKIADYINRCLNVCSVYYFWRSVIAFTDDPRNRNAGMDALRDRLTPDDYNNLFNLRREMMQSAIPPFVHEFCFYIMGTYRQNHLPTSPIMKIMPFRFATTSNAYFDGTVALENNLSPVDMARGHLSQLREFNNILSRAIGDWGGIEPFEYTSSPRVDFNYTTFWTNANYVGSNTNGGNYFPRIASISEEVTYNIHTDAPDGWVSAMVSPYVADTNQFGVGLFHDWVLHANGTQLGTSFCYYGSGKMTTCLVYNADSVAGFYPVESAQYYQSLSGNTYTTVLTSGVYHKFQKFGTERVILTSVNALRQANFQFLELLYTTDLRKLGSSPGISQGKEISASKSGKNPYGGRKRRGKRRGSSSMKDESSGKDEL